MTRARRTKSQIATLDAAIYDACAEDQPLTVRGVFYRVLSTGIIAKAENQYPAVARRVLCHAPQR